METLLPPQRERLAQLSDILIPQHMEMPSATELALTEAGGWVDRVLSVRPDLVPPLRDVLDQMPSGGAPEEWLSVLENSQPNAMEVLLQTVFGAYYLHPEVRGLICYPGQQAQTLDRGAIGAEELLAEMMERPPHWRQVHSPHSSTVQEVSGRWT